MEPVSNSVIVSQSRHAGTAAWDRSIHKYRCAESFDIVEYCIVCRWDTIPDLQFRVPGKMTLFRLCALLRND
jgi:hypothetical protein